MLKIVATALVFVGCVIAGPSPGFSQDIERGPWSCIVGSVVFASDDAEFARANMLKTFSIFREGNTYFVTMMSPRHDDSVTRYDIIRRGFVEVYAIGASGGGLNLLSMLSNPSIHLDENGLFEATISIDYPGMSNSWILECEG